MTTAQIPRAAQDLAALQNRETEDVKVFSLNFTGVNTTNASEVSGYAGVVADTNWNNVALYNNSFVSLDGALKYSDEGTSVLANGVNISISAYNVGTLITQ